MKIPVNEQQNKSQFNKNEKFKSPNKDLHRAELVFVDYDNEAYYTEIII